MQAAQSDRRRQRNDKKSANEIISIITERKDLYKWTPNKQRGKERKKKPTRYDKPTQDLLFPIQVHRLVIGI